MTDWQTIPVVTLIRLPSNPDANQNANPTPNSSWQIDDLALELNAFKKVLFLVIVHLFEVIFSVTYASTRILHSCSKFVVMQTTLFEFALAISSMF